ncbi:MAG: PilZ domain-containing protein [Deltaproteobacteria bacterium]
MASKNDQRNQPSIAARWPITIITKGGRIEGESRNITVTGVFINCDEDLEKDEACRMVIKPPRKNSIEVKGKLVWSNRDSNKRRGSLPGMGFSFVKVDKEDLHLLSQAVLSTFEYQREECEEKGGPEVEAGAGENHRDDGGISQQASRIAKN